ncbi:MAG: porin [Methylotenera sp.]|uniref:porin n=1 Tax=Methylotenera sp. TaxID=2051956 RepID=UPI002731173E|nr:porin [Methylotenera sp.]MDP1523459.1 porin [Methylotenera sp.]
MNNTIKLAVASALLAAASSANAGIMIPAGDWTLDIGGNVNAYYTSTRQSGSLVIGNTPLGLSNDAGSTTSNITTGLLPNFLSVSGKTRQNDLDVGFTISINPGSSNTGPLSGTSQENRQAFLTFGDASWGTIKLGKDLGIYASDAILSDMTLLGVGSGAGALAGGTTTLGRIGTGFMYADWKSQVAYSSPNWNGFSFTAGVTQAWNGSGNTLRGGSEPAFEGKASYAWAGDFAGKVWVSGITQNMESLNDRANAWDIGANVNVAGFGLTGYYGQGEGTGTTILFNKGYAGTQARDSDDWYVQGTYALPGVGTKLGLSYGQSTLDAVNAADAANEEENTMWTVGAYHPLTKHLNLVAEYSDVKREVGVLEGKSKTVALGAILFF